MSARDTSESLLKKMIEIELQCLQGVKKLREQILEVGPFLRL